MDFKVNSVIDLLWRKMTKKKKIWKNFVVVDQPNIGCVFNGYLFVSGFI